MTKNSNPNIHCTVTQCHHNAGDGMHCSLNEITVGTHEENPTKCQCTDCMSFRIK